MHGRVDDVINISGHRLSTAEIEQAVISHPKISDVASISVPDEIKGEAVIVFVVMKNSEEKNSIEDEIKQHIAEQIGKVALPINVFVISDLPKTRTGKIMRRLLKAKVLGQELGDLSSLENPTILDEIPKMS